MLRPFFYAMNRQGTPGVMAMVFALGLCGRGAAQTFPFTSGPIPPCDTSTFTANVSGVGWLVTPGMDWGSYLDNVTINITSDHPQTLQVFLTSPQGTVLLLSQFNGAGGQNYTNTVFSYFGWTPITSGTAPFTGTWMPQGGGLNVFDYQNGDGIWTVTVIDTACANGGTGPDGTWTPGWFDGSGGTAGIAFGFSNGPPPCQGWIPSDAAYICPGETVDIMGYYQLYYPGGYFDIMLNGVPVADPSQVSTPGTYEVTMIDPWDGCWYWATYTVMAPAMLGPDQTVDQCGAAPVDLTALYPLNGATPAWSLNGSPISVATAASATVPGVYQLVTQTSCSDTALVTLNITDGPSLGADQAANVCDGASLDLGTFYYTAGLSAAWTLAGAPVADPGAVSTAGTYQLVVTNGAGCSDTAQVTLSLQAQLSLGADQAIEMCGSTSLDLSSLYWTGGLTTTWTLAGAPVANPSSVAAAGTYQLVASNGGTCADTAQVTLTVQAQPSLGADQAVDLCDNASLDLTSLYTTTGLAAAWTLAGAPVADPSSVAAAGTYQLVASSGGTCADTAQVTLTLQAQPSLGADQTIDLCGNASLDLTALYTTTGLTAAWTLAGTPVADPSSISADGTYQLVASNGGACADTALVAVTLAAAPALGPDASATVCDDATADLNTFFIVTGLNVAWTLSGAPVATPGAVSTAGLYTLVATNAQGCGDTARVDLSASAGPQLGADQSVSACQGTGTDLTDLFATGANSTAWSLNGAPVADPASATSAGGYTLIATNADGCADTAVVILQLTAAPALGTDQLAIICGGTVFDLTASYATSGLTSAWTLNGTAVANPSAVTITGDYRLVAVNGAGCSDTAVVSLLVNPAPALGPDLWFTLCPWQTVDLGTVFPVAGLDAVYTLNGEPVADPSAVADTGIYVVSVTDAYGCTDEAQVSVSAIACLCEADFTADARCVQDPARFMLLADSTVLAAHWDFNGAAVPSQEIDPVTRFAAEGEVLVTLEATLSCGTVNVQRTIHMDDCSDSCTVWIPSAFTPDGDAHNDAWTWSGACAPEDFSMRVFNRYGEVIFSSTDPLRAWDGTYGGAQSPPGVYSYRVGYRLPYQDNKVAVGTITLLR